VHGFRLAAGKTFNMVLGVGAIAQGDRATSQGMLVYYHDSSGAYVAKNYWANILAANTHACARTGGATAAAQVRRILLLARQLSPPSDASFRTRGPRLRPGPRN
jgi:hypothetical protein